MAGLATTEGRVVDLCDVVVSDSRRATAVDPHAIADAVADTGTGAGNGEVSNGHVLRPAHSYDRLERYRVCGDRWRRLDHGRQRYLREQSEPVRHDQNLLRICPRADLDLIAWKCGAHRHLDARVLRVRALGQVVVHREQA